MKDEMKTSIREATRILAAAVILGFSYTGFTGKGIFAPQPETQTSVDTSAAPQFISYEEALALFEGRSAIFVDGRHSYDFGLGHIKGAISVPLADIRTNPNILGALPRNRPLVTYCDGAECNSSIELAMKLDSLGYENVKIFFGGWKEWVAGNQPIEKTQ